MSRDGIEGRSFDLRPESARPGRTLPEGEPRFDPMVLFHFQLHQATPRVWVVFLLTAIILAGYIWEYALSGEFIAISGRALIDAGSNFGPKTLGGQWWRLLSSIFLHGSLMHLAMNLYCFLSFGMLVERLIGNRGLAILFLVAGICGSIASVNWNPLVNSVGASGAVFGVAGGLIAFLLRQRKEVPAQFVTELTNSAVSFVVLNVIMAASDKRIDQAAHLGGLAGGFLVGWIQAGGLSPESVAWRPLRDLMAAGLGIALFVGAMFVHRPAPVDIESEFGSIIAEQQRIVNHYSQLVANRGQNPETDAAIAGRIEQEAIKPWKELRQRLDRLRQQPNVKPEPIAKVADFFAKREESWTNLVEFLKTQDRNALMRHKEAEAAAKERLDAIE